MCHVNHAQALRPGRRFAEEMEQPREDQLIEGIMLHPDAGKRILARAIQITIEGIQLVESAGIAGLEILRTNPYEFFERFRSRHRALDIRLRQRTKGPTASCHPQV